MEPRQEAMLEEWKEIRESLRYFGRKRFAQLTVFIAASGFMFDHALANPQAPTTLGVGIAGIVLTVTFYVMERSAVGTWRGFVKRGKIIEEALGHLELMTKFRLEERHQWFSGTAATYRLYEFVCLAWLTVVVRWFLLWLGPGASRPIGV